MKTLLSLPAVALLLITSSLLAQERPEQAIPAFDEVGDKALRAMEIRAAELNIKGVAVVAFAVGDRVTSWSSKMVVLGNLTSPPSPTSKGNNFLGIVYAKAAEMATTLKDSGSGIRPPYTGEFGWQGGVVARGKTGILISAFSGGRSEDDVKVAQAGLAVLAESL
jgi:hypothetical protein